MAAGRTWPRRERRRRADGARGLPGDACRLHRGRGPRPKTRRLRHARRRPVRSRRRHGHGRAPSGSGARTWARRTIACTLGLTKSRRRGRWALRPRRGRSARLHHRLEPSARKRCASRTTSSTADRPRLVDSSRSTSTGSHRPEAPARRSARTAPRLADYPSTVPTHPSNSQHPGLWSFELVSRPERLHVRTHDLGRLPTASGQPFLAGGRP
jgi:hypothetical protein